MPNLLAVYGSPRRDGNTDVLLNSFLQGVKGSEYGIERIVLRELCFSHCNECRGCAKTGVCILKDDMTPIYSKLLHYERLVMAFPVFFLGPPAQVKAFIDRAQSLWIRKYVLRKPEENRAPRKGFLLSVGGFQGSEKVFRCNISIVRSFYATCGFRYGGELLFGGIDKRGDVQKREDIHLQALKAGSHFIKDETNH